MPSYSPQAVRTANAIGRWKRRANTEHRKPPPGIKLLPKHKLLPILLERDGPLCQCGCGKPIDPDNWEAEHTISLESVKDLPDALRGKYFLPENQKAYRPGCQKRKSAREARDRAHLIRLAEKQQGHQARMAAKLAPKDDE